MSRIMIFAEAVTLAHVARPIALSRILRDLGHDVCIAAAPAADRWLEGEDVAREHIGSIAASAFLRALARGTPAYDVPTLVRYVDDDLRAIAAWAPDIVIGDFRLSLPMSSKLSGKPYGAIANAYWSRRYWQDGVAPPMPPFTFLPRAAAARLFTAIRPVAFALHALPFHRACRHFGVPSPGLDLRDVYTASDATAFADVEALYEPRGASTTSADTHFIGPLAWEPPGASPVPSFPDGSPVVFVSLGSSGQPRLLVSILETLSRLPVRCLVATGHLGPDSLRLPANCVHAANFISYDAACAVAALMIGNGGAPSTYAALAHGRRVLAFPANLDQALNVEALSRASPGNVVAPGTGRRGFSQNLQDALADTLSGVATPAPIPRISVSTDALRRACQGWVGRLATGPGAGKRNVE